MRENPVRPMVGVGAVIIQNGKVLLVKRANEPNKGYWSVPGGLVRVGESLRSALAREVKEETGLEIEIGDVACVSEEIIGNGEVRFHYVIIDFFSEIKGGEPKAGSDALEVRWFDINSIDSSEKVVDFVKKLMKNLKHKDRTVYLK
ncbi:ADP-ribose pyrophosphatase [Archaeoglobus sulfaticallidus PM70-1]|uniref:ADP-ribose pyrophosphatase n=1 Tax=Archaeoglobus sulfaticallidus PM70-1 TaxID=387631 RepID=N0BHT5_9EURY|nr:NUDIX hydrolase [Archaeoglobus sulfaticallidus]AGK61872.1 ADP-ribose pyrophosphatase [Archaeoglobus sulfaticallidus PM70-1]